MSARRPSAVAGANLLLSGSGFRVSGFGLLVSGVWFRISGCGFLVSGLEFLVFGVGCQVSGFAPESGRRCEPPRLGVWSLGCWGLRFWVLGLDLGLGVRGLECGVWG